MASDIQLNFLLNKASDEDLGASFEFYNSLFRELFMNMYLADSGLLGNTKYIQDMSEEEYQEYDLAITHLLISGFDLRNFFRS